MLVPSYSAGFSAPGGSGAWTLVSANWSDGGAPQNVLPYVQVSGSGTSGTITITDALPASFWTGTAPRITVEVFDASGSLGTVDMHLRVLPDFFLAHGTVADEVAIAAVGSSTFTMSVTSAPPGAAALEFAPGTRRLQLPVAFGAWPAASDSLTFEMAVAVADPANGANDWVATFAAGASPQLAVRRLEAGGAQLAGFAMLGGRIAGDAESAIDAALPGGATATAAVTGLSAPTAITFDASMRIQEPVTETGDAGTAALEIDPGGGRPTVRGSFPIEARALAYSIPWDSAAGTNVPISPDPGANRFVYDSANDPGPFTVGGAGGTALDLSWAAGSLIADSSFTLDLRMTRDLAGYPQEHVNAPLTVGPDTGGPDAGTDPDAGPDADAGGLGDGGAPADDAGADAGGQPDSGRLDGGRADGGGPAAGDSCDCRATPGARRPSAFALAVLPLLLVIGRRRKLGVGVPRRSFRLSPYLLAAALVAVALALLLSR